MKPFWINAAAWCLRRAGLHPHFDVRVLASDKNVFGARKGSYSDLEQGLAYLRRVTQRMPKGTTVLWLSCKVQESRIVAGGIGPITLDKIRLPRVNEVVDEET